MHADFLLQCLAETPHLQPQDALKWLYQSAFGCGHLLAEPDACAASIHTERSAIAADAGQPPFTLLAGGLCRLHLASPAVRALPAPTVARMMAETQRGIDLSAAREAYARSTALLRHCLTAPGDAPALPFSTAQWDACMAARSADPYAPPRHSEVYRQAYRPAYRVVRRHYGETLPLLAALETSLAATGRATLVLDGDCAAGKTTLAARIAGLYPSTVIHLDDFFLPFSMRTPERMAEPGGNVHRERFAQEVLDGLLRGGAFSYGVFDCHTGSTVPTAVQPRPVTILEGSYALHPAFAPQLDRLGAVRAFLRIQPQAQAARILARNGAAMLARFQNEWIPLEKRYHQAYHKTWSGALPLAGDPHIADEP
ncbi:MAG: hypothetical protein VB087_09095 [Candidatus Limiplasma sp.]|nr:hypothetical protein [Candidatus Limiplasma sp.]MEA5144660.1 hypothetical protein [Candidatus Limiplasma sp.]